jgi:hypothetical protein
MWTVAAFFVPIPNQIKNKMSIENSNESDLIQEIFEADAEDIEQDDLGQEEEQEEEDEDEQEEEEEESEEDQEQEEDESEDDDDEQEEEDEEEEQEDENKNEFLTRPYFDQVKAFFPDREFNSPEDFETATNEMIGNLQYQIQEDQKANESLIEMFNNNPRTMKLAQLLIQGVPERVAYYKAGFTPEEFEADPDDPDFEQVVLAKHESKKQREQAEKERQKIAQNAEKSQKTLVEFQKSKRLNDSEYSSFTGWIEGLINSVIDADLNNEVLDKLFQAYTYKDAVKKAKLHGEIEGRNQKIQIEKKRKKGDGLPKLVGNSVKESNKKVYDDPFTQLMDDILKDV